MMYGVGSTNDPLRVESMFDWGAMLQTLVALCCNRYQWRVSMGSSMPAGPYAEFGDFVVCVNRPGDADGLVVWLRGEHDAWNSAFLEATLLAAMDVSADDLRLDLSGVEFMSASTIGVVVVVHERLRQCGRSLSVRSPSVRALQLLRICGLEHFVTGHLPDRRH